MADILTFKPRDTALSTDRFCEDRDETVRFHRTPDGAIELDRPKTSWHTRADVPSVRDWSNQELANLFRVKALLQAAGIAIEIDRGLSDEGDPWFVFCHESGDVFIHFCRIDGLYLLDNPNLQHPLRGHDFNDLVSDFTRNALPQTPSDDTIMAGHTVVRFDRSGTLRLHPSTILAALVWSLLLASEELVLPVNSPDDDAGRPSADTLIEFSNAIETARPDTPHGPVYVPQKEDDSGPMQDHKAASSFQPNSMAPKDMVSHSGLAITPNSFGLGLSSIAFALGLVSERSLTEPLADILEETEHALAVLGQVLVTTDATSGLLDAGQTENSIWGLDAPLEQSLTASQVSAATSVPLAMDQAVKMAGLVAPQNSDISGAFGTRIIADTSPENSTLSAPDSAASQDLPYVLPKSDTEQNTKDLVTISVQGVEDLLQIWQTSLESFVVQGEIFFASFDILEVTNNTSTPIGPGVSSPDTALDNHMEIVPWTPLPQLAADRSIKTLIDTAVSLADAESDKRAFDKDAAAFIHFMLDRLDNFEVVQTDDDYVFLDFDTVMNNPNAPLHLMSWSLDDGGVVTTIGLRSDFESFELTA